MGKTLKIALIAVFILSLMASAAMAQGQLRAKFKIIDAKTKEVVVGVKALAFSPQRPNNKWTKTSDNKGEFVLIGIEPGRIVVELTHERYQNARIQRRMRTGVPYMDFVVELQPIIRQAGQVTKEIQAKYMEGLSLYEEKKVDEALAVFLKLLEDYPDITPLNVSVAKCFSDKGEHQKAIDYLNIALESEPQNDALMLNVAESYRAMQEDEKANEWYKKIIEINPQQVYALEMLAMAAYVNSKYDEAVGYYLKVLEVDANNALAHFYLGANYYGLSKWEEAISHFEKYIELETGNEQNVNFAKETIAEIKKRLEQ